MKRLLNLLLLGITFVCFDANTICIDPGQVVAVVDLKSTTASPNVYSRWLTKGYKTLIFTTGDTQIVKESVTSVTRKLINGQ